MNLAQREKFWPGNLQSSKLGLDEVCSLAWSLLDKGMIPATTNYFIMRTL